MRIQIVYCCCSKYNCELTWLCVDSGFNMSTRRPRQWLFLLFLDLYPSCNDDEELSNDHANTNHVVVPRPRLVGWVMCSCLFVCHALFSRITLKVMGGFQCSLGNG